MKTLEQILQENFNCEKPFLDTPYFDEEECAPVTLTEQGSRAYADLVSLLYDIGKLSGINANGIIEELDDIVSELL